METYDYNDNVTTDYNPAMPSSSYAIDPDFSQPSVINPIRPPFPNVNTRPNGCVNCGNGFRPNNNAIYWTWQLLSPFINSSARLAHVRFFNATAIREPLDIYLNNRLVLSGLDRMNSSGYLHITPGFYRMTVYRRGVLSAPIINRNVQFRNGNSYLLTILGTANNATLQIRNQ